MIASSAGMRVGPSRKVIRRARPAGFRVFYRRPAKPTARGPRINWREATRTGFGDGNAGARMRARGDRRLPRGRRGARGARAGLDGHEAAVRRLRGSMVMNEELV